MEANEALIPAVEFGIRSIPVTKVQSGEMIPVVEKPTIQYVAEEASEPGVDGELQLTDAISKLSAVRGVELRGDRYDNGNIPDWLCANLPMAVEHDDREINEAVEELFENE